MRRSVVSIPSNIAEGQQRGSTKEYIHFLYIAKGSLAELETQLLLCSRMNYLANSDVDSALALASEVSKMLNTMIRNLVNKINNTNTTKTAIQQESIRA